MKQKCKKMNTSLQMATLTLINDDHDRDCKVQLFYTLKFY